jgi:hypothetical protein
MMSLIPNSAALWNCNSLSQPKLSMVQSFCVSNRPLFVGLCESKLNPFAADPVVPAYISVSKPFLSNSGGLLLFVHDSVNVIRRADLELDCPHILFVDFISANPADSFTLGLCYRQAAAGEEGWRLLSNAISKAAAKSKRLLLLGDFNAHNPAWGSATADLYGNELFELCLECSLLVLNSALCYGDPTFFRQHCESSVLDLAISSDATMLHALQPDQTANLVSDHLPLTMTLSFTADFAKPAAHRRWTLESADWQQFSALIAAALPNAAAEVRIAKNRHMLRMTSASETMERLWSIVRTHLLGAATVAVGEKTVNPKQRDHLPPHLKALLARYNAANRIRCRHRDAASESAYQSARSVWLAGNAAHQAQLWAGKAAASPENPASTAQNRVFTHWSKLTKPRSLPVNRIVDDAGRPAANAKASLNLIGEFFASCSKSPEEKIDNVPGSAANSIISEANRALSANFERRSFSIADVKAALRKGGVNIALGPDRIHPLFLRNAPDGFIKLLAEVLNFSWDFAVLPLEWRSANVTPLFKGAGDRRQRNNYRPISLTSIVSKILERCVLKKLWKVLKNKISTRQAGFRPHYSTHDAIYRLQSAVFDALERDDLPAAEHYLSVAFLDISKAFDSVWHAGLLCKLSRLGVAGQLLRWLQAFLTDRRIRVVHNNSSSEWFNIFAGVPQGCILSPLLFLAFINDITDTLYRYRCDAALFADDIGLWSLSNLGERADSDLNLTLREIDDWAILWKVQFSTTKSVFVCYYKGQNRPDNVIISLDGEGKRPIPRVEFFKYLGARLSANCRWHDHVDKLRGSVAGLCSMICRHISALGPGPTIIRTLVASLVYPIITYSMPFWRPTATDAAQLDQILAWPLRKVLGLPRSTHAASVLCDFGLLPISFTWDLNAFRFGIRALHPTMPADHPTMELYSIQADSDVSARPIIRRTAGKTGTDRSHDYNLNLHFVTAKMAQTAVQDAFFRSWKADLSTASTLKSVRADSTLATYLQLDDLANAKLRAAFRHNRAPTNRQLFLQGKAPAETCNCDCPSETIAHRLTECKLLQAPRQLATTRLALLCQDLAIQVPFSLSFVFGELPAGLSEESQCELLAISARYIKCVFPT